jgi:DNA-binding transcriptional LysR family regulator
LNDAARRSRHDLQFHDCVLFSYGTTRQVWSINEEPVRVSGTYRTNSSLAQHEAVRNGAGISLFAYFPGGGRRAGGPVGAPASDARIEPVPFT